MFLSTYLDEVEKAYMVPVATVINTDDKLISLISLIDKIVHDAQFPFFCPFLLQMLPLPFPQIEQISTFPHVPCPESKGFSILGKLQLLLIVSLMYQKVYV